MRLGRIIIAIAFLISTSANSIAQSWYYNISKKNPSLKSTDKELSFKEKQEAFNKFWEVKKVEKGKGFKPFKRWEYFTEPRIDNTGQINSIALWKAINEKLKNSVADSANWTFIGPHETPYEIESTNLSGNGRLNCIAFHPSNPDIIYVGAPSGGFWITEDFGTTWRTTTDMLDAIGISDIVVSHSDPSTIYIATGDGDAYDTYAIGILKSDNNGENWSPTSLSLEASQTISFRRLIMDPTDSDKMYATSNVGIYRTTDGWVTYTNVQSGNFKDIEFKPGDPEVIYATSYDNAGNASVYRSTNGGTVFSESISGMDIEGNVNRIELAVSPANSNYVYAIASDASNDGFYAFYRSTNSGNSWTLMFGTTANVNLLGWTTTGQDLGGQGWYDLALAVSPTDINTIYAGGINIWKSDDGGNNWELSSYWRHIGGFEYVHADQHIFQFSPHNDALFVVNDGGVYYTNNDGSTWNDISSDLQILQTYKLGVSQSVSGKLVCGNQDNGTFLYENSEWFQILGGDGMECFIDPHDENIIYGSLYYGDLRKSTDGGLFFNSIIPAPSLEGDWVTPFIMHPLNSDILYAGYKKVYKSVNKGSSWTEISGALDAENLTSLAIAPSNDNVIYASTDRKIFKTTNNGNNWEEITTGLPGNSITSIAVSPNDPNKVWVTFSGYSSLNKVFFSENGGTNWINYSDSLPNVPVNKLIVRYNSNQELFAATDIGVYYRNGETEYWQNFSKNLPNVIVTDLEIVENINKLRASTYGRGLWETVLQEAMPSKAEFSSNINSGCINAPIKLMYEGSANFDSLVWSTDNANILGQSTNKDTIEIEFSTTGKKTIGLKHYLNDTLTNEIKYDFISITNTLSFVLPANRYYVCYRDTIDILLNDAFDYLWEPSDGLDTSKGNTVSIDAYNSTTYTVTAQHGECIAYDSIKIVAVSDSVCNALFIPLGMNGPFSNQCASIESFEPSAPVGSDPPYGCTSQDGWCSGEDRIDNSVWFKLVVPPSGRIGVTVEGFDCQIALYKTTSCEGILTYNYDLLAANDDIDDINFNSRINVLTNQTPGDTLYLQIDGSIGGMTGEFTVYLTEARLIPTSLPEPISNIRIFPNPATDLITVKLIVPGKSNVSVNIYSETGKLVCEKYTKSPVSFYEDTFNVSGLNGIYFVQVVTKKSTIVQKLIVK